MKNLSGLLAVLAILLWGSFSNAQNLIDSSDWIPNSSGSTTNYAQSGTDNHNSRITMPGPYDGNPVTVWQMNATGVSSMNGGFTHNGILVDTNKTYRFTFWVRSSGNVGCTNYLGFNVYNTSNSRINPFTDENGNDRAWPYFSSTNLLNDTWLLMVAYVRPSSASDAGDSGIYNPLLGSATNLPSTSYSATDFIMPSNESQIELRTRSFFWNCGAGEKMFIYDPRIEEVNNALPLSELLYGVQGTNTDTDNNQDTNTDVTYTPVVKINAGGSEETYDGKTFSADQYAVENYGSWSSTYVDQSIPKLFRDVRFSKIPTTGTHKMSYAIPVSNGDYRVTLHFLESYFSVNPNNDNRARIFDVSIENSIVEDNLDVVARVGINAVYSPNFNATVNDNTLNIDLESIVDGFDPIINAIEVDLITANSGDNPTDGEDTTGGGTPGGEDTGSTGTTGGHWTKTGSNLHYLLGNVGIGTNAILNYKLAVDGKIRSREVKVDNDNWADYVFFNDYKLPTLEEVEHHIQEKGHLINIPSAAQVETNGIELGDMNRLLLEKIEELTLYTIQQQKEIEELKELTKTQK